MADLDAHLAMPKPARRVGGLLAAMTASLLLGACSQMSGEESAGLFSSLSPEPQAAPQAALASDPRAATEYWGGQYAKNPRDLPSALAYARNLRVMGQKREAMAVLQQASLIHGSNRELAADYGRLALELDQISVAKKVLAIADDAANPDWRIVMARGTALAKEGSYREAISYFERAQALNPNHPSILNNLALAYTMSGEADRGEQLLRQASASASGNENSKVRQNLALVLGLQGKYEEATQIGSVDLPVSDAAANTAMLKKMVKLDAKPMAPSVIPATAWATEVARVAPKPAPAPRKVVAADRATPALRASTIETGFGGISADNRAAGLFTAD